jgi:ribosomal protein S6
LNDRRYEGFFLIDNNRANQAWDDVVGHIGELVGKHSGSIVKTLRWDERKLAFEIKGHRRGTYALLYFDIDPEQIEPLRRDFQLSDEIMRSVIVRLHGEMLESPADLYADGARDEPAPEGGTSAPAADGETPGPVSEAPKPVAEAPKPEAEEAATEKAETEEAAAEKVETEKVGEPSSDEAAPAEASDD